MIKFFCLGVAAALIAIAAMFFLKPMFRPARVSSKEIYAASSTARIDHTVFDALLKKNVKNGRVDYANLKKEQDALRGYLKSLEALDAKLFSRNELLAMFVNAYNACTLELILEHYPGIASIKDIPAGKRWDDKRWTVCGELLSLSELEHSILRKRFEEPRIHFAINCASISCPPLRSEAYTGDAIDAQLQEQALMMNREFGGAQWDAGTGMLRLSKIYDWYEGDFTRAGELKDYVARYVTVDVAEQLKKKTKVDIVFLEYNWTLNDVQK